MSACVCLLSACESTGPKVDATTFPLPPAYRNAMASAEAAPTPESTTGTVRANWWTQYGSEELNRLVDRALAHNADLRVATLQVAQAKIRSDQARAGRLPTLSAPVRAVVQSQGSNTDSQQNSQMGLAGAFRLDVWGEQRALVDSADMQLQRAVHERENTQRNTIGSLVNTYVAYLSVSDSMLIARENEAVAADILRTVERRMQLGDATADDLEQQRAVLFSQQVVLPGLENQQEDLRNAISRLVGALPGNVTLSDKGLDALQLPTVQTGLPSALLLGRPDIRMMEARMRAANANIDVARARLLPAIDLSSQVGYSGATLATLFQPQNFLVNTAAALALSIFDGGVKRGEQAFAQSYYEEMVETYGKTVLQAVREVESSLVSLKTTGRRLEAQKAVTRSALNIFRISSEAYAAGAIDQTALLEGRKNYQRSADETQRVKADLLRSYANLSYALGLGATTAEQYDFQEGSWVLHVDDADAKFSPRAVESDIGEVRAKNNNKHDAQWTIEFSGVVPSAAIHPFLRDLQFRFPIETKGKSLEGVSQWSQDKLPAEIGTWFRLRMGRFSTENEALAFCVKVTSLQSSCKIESAQR
jgi:NodT family efflux transporter outer membrane factor (OMF) lipoprotein